MVDQEAKGTVRVLVVDDQAVVTEGLSQLITDDGRFEVVGTADNGQAAIEAVIAKRPDLVLMDVNMHGMDGIDAAKAITSLQGAPKVLMLSVHDNGDLVEGALEAGASGYALKSIHAAQLLDAMVEVANGVRFLCPVAQASLDRLRERSNGSTSKLLTARERQVVELIMQEKSNLEIASELGLHVGTVETHRKNILHKLNVQSVVGLVRYALERGWHIHLPSAEGEVDTPREKREDGGGHP